MINSSLHQNIIAAEGGWIVTLRPLVSLLLGIVDEKSIATLNEVTNQLDQIYASCAVGNTVIGDIEPDNSFHIAVCQKLHCILNAY
jgi:hypothetical protein